MLDGITAKNISLEVWSYFRDHPEVMEKSDLPPVILDKIKDMRSRCPLCDYFKDDCFLCPLDNCYTSGSLFGQWTRTSELETRSKIASMIYQKIEEWIP